MKDGSYTCVLCARAGPCRQNKECQRYHVGLEEVTDGVFKYPDYATAKKLRCGLVHPGEKSACEMFLATKMSLIRHQRRQESLELCYVCRVWHHIKETCTQPFRHQSEGAVAYSNAQNSHYRLLLPAGNADTFRATDATAIGTRSIYTRRKRRSC